MKAPILRLFSASTAGIFSLAATLFLAPIYAAPADSRPTSTPPATEGRLDAVADRDATLARLLKILNYGDMVSMSRPTKADAVIALGLLGDQRAVPVLVDHLQNEENQNLRLQITKALGWIGSSEAVPVLEKTLLDPYPFLRKQAAVALKGITGRDYDYDKTGLPDPAQLLELLRKSRRETP